MKYIATSGAFVLAFTLLLVAGTANGQSFEDEDLGNWYPNTEDGNYDTAAEITDERASDGSYSVRVSVGSDLAEGAFANDNQPVSAGDTLTYRVWVDQSNLDQINGIQPFAQDDSWSYETPGYIDVTAGEWNTIGIRIPDEWSGTNRIGIQIDANSESDTPTIFVDQITRNGTLLPVELTAFDAVQDGNDVTLKWQTASETNNAGFEVEQRRKGDSWTQVGFVEGSGTSGQAQSYSHSLTDLTPGQYAFRLRQVDYDGSAAYSSEVAVQIRSEGAFELSSPAPNPFEEQAQFTVTASEQQEVRVEVFNTLGQRVAELHDGPLGAGEVRSFSLESSDLPSGVYFVRGQSASHSVTHRLVLVQ